jgi:hypothetical protein
VFIDSEYHFGVFAFVFFDHAALVCVRAVSAEPNFETAASDACGVLPDLKVAFVGKALRQCEDGQDVFAFHLTGGFLASHASNLASVSSYLWR